MHHMYTANPHEATAVFDRSGCLQVVDAANAAQDKIQQMEVECSRLHHQNKHLQSVLQQLEVEVTELKADAETRDSALESLQEAMSKIERSANPTHARTTSPLSGIYNICYA